RLDLGVMPQFLCMFRRARQPSLHTIRFSIFHQSQVCHLMSQIVNISSLCFHTPFSCDAEQFFRIFHLIISVRSHMGNGMAYLASMIGMGSRSSRNKTQEISSRDTMGVASADSPWCLGGDTAGPHGTDPAAYSLFTELTVRRLVLHTKLPGIRAYSCACFQQTL